MWDVLESSRLLVVARADSLSLFRYERDTLTPSLVGSVQCASRITFCRLCAVGESVAVVVGRGREVEWAWAEDLSSAAPSLSRLYRLPAQCEALRGVSVQAREGEGEGEFHVLLFAEEEVFVSDKFRERERASLSFSVAAITSDLGLTRNVVKDCLDCTTEVASAGCVLLMQRTTESGQPYLQWMRTEREKERLKLRLHWRLCSAADTHTDTAPLAVCLFSSTYNPQAHESTDTHALVSCSQSLYLASESGVVCVCDRETLASHGAVCAIAECSAAPSLLREGLHYFLLYTLRTGIVWAVADTKQRALTLLRSHTLCTHTVKLIHADCGSLCEGEPPLIAPQRLCVLRGSVLSVSDWRVSERASERELVVRTDESFVCVLRDDAVGSQLLAHCAYYTHNTQPQSRSALATLSSLLCAPSQLSPHNILTLAQTSSQNSLPPAALLLQNTRAQRTHVSLLTQRHAHTQITHTQEVDLFGAADVRALYVSDVWCVLTSRSLSRTALLSLNTCSQRYEPSCVGALCEEEESVNVWCEDHTLLQVTPTQICVSVCTVENEHTTGAHRNVWKRSVKDIVCEHSLRVRECTVRAATLVTPHNAATQPVQHTLCLSVGDAVLCVRVSLAPHAHIHAVEAIHSEREIRTLCAVSLLGWGPHTHTERESVCCVLLSVWDSLSLPLYVIPPNAHKTQSPALSLSVSSEATHAACVSVGDTALWALSCVDHTLLLTALSLTHTSKRNVTVCEILRERVCYVLRLVALSHTPTQNAETNTAHIAVCTRTETLLLSVIVRSAQHSDTHTDQERHSVVWRTLFSHTTPSLSLSPLHSITQTRKKLSVGWLLCDNDVCVLGRSELVSESVSCRTQRSLAIPGCVLAASLSLSHNVAMALTQSHTERDADISHDSDTQELSFAFVGTHTDTRIDAHTDTQLSIVRPYAHTLTHTQSSFTVCAPRDVCMFTPLPVCARVLRDEATDADCETELCHCVSVEDVSECAEGLEESVCGFSRVRRRLCWRTLQIRTHTHANSDTLTECSVVSELSLDFYDRDLWSEADALSVAERLTVCEIDCDCDGESVCGSDTHTERCAALLTQDAQLRVLRWQCDEIVTTHTDMHADTRTESVSVSSSEDLRRCESLWARAARVVVCASCVVASGDWLHHLCALDAETTLATQSRFHTDQLTHQYESEHRLGGLDLLVGLATHRSFAVTAVALCGLALFRLVRVRSERGRFELKELAQFRDESLQMANYWATSRLGDSESDIVAVVKAFGYDRGAVKESGTAASACMHIVTFTITRAAHTDEDHVLTRCDFCAIPNSFSRCEVAKVVHRDRASSRRLCGAELRRWSEQRDIDALIAEDFFVFDSDGNCVY